MCKPGPNPAHPSTLGPTSHTRSRWGRLCTVNRHPTMQTRPKPCSTARVGAHFAQYNATQVCKVGPKSNVGAREGAGGDADVGCGVRTAGGHTEDATEQTRMDSGCKVDHSTTSTTALGPTSHSKPPPKCANPGQTRKRSWAPTEWLTPILDSKAESYFLLRRW